MPRPSSTASPRTRPNRTPSSERSARARREGGQHDHEVERRGLDVGRQARRRSASRSRRRRPMGGTGPTTARSPDGSGRAGGSHPGARPRRRRRGRRCRPRRRVRTVEGEAARTPRARPAMTRPSVAPPTVPPATNQAAVLPYRWPRPRSARGVTVASMETPQGDQVERIPATTATTAAAAINSACMRAPFPSRRRPEERGAAEGEDPPVLGHQPVAGVVAVGRQAHHRLIELERAG